MTNRDMMEAIKLFTILNQEVATIAVPAFEPMPEIIQWGARLFVRQADGRYVEGMLWIHPDPETLRGVVNESRILIELANLRSGLLAAMAEHNSYNSHHEAYAVILEELCEYWDQVRLKTRLRSNNAMREELTDIATTAIRAILDLKL